MAEPDDGRDVGGEDAKQQGMAWWSAIPLLLVIAAAGSTSIRLAAWVRAQQQHLLLNDAIARVLSDPLNLAFAQAFGILAAIFVGLRVFTSASSNPESLRQSLHLARISVVSALSAFIAGAALQFPLAELSNWVQVIAPQEKVQVDWIHRLIENQLLPWPLTFLCVALIPPITEEVFFRGFLLPRFLLRYGPASAIGLSALYFGFVHFSAHAMVYASVAGYVLGWAAYSTQSTITAMCIHVGVNTTPLVLTKSRLPIVGFNVAPDHGAHIPVTWLLGSTFTAAFLLFVIGKSKKRQILSTS